MLQIMRLSFRQLKPLFNHLTTQLFCVFLLLATLAACAMPDLATKPSAQQAKPGDPYCTGYSKDFQDAKNQLRSGNCQKLIQAFNKEENELRQKSKTEADYAHEVGLLKLMEKGSIYLSLGMPERSVTSFSSAEIIIKERDDESYTSEGAAKGASILASISGFGEAGRYYPAGFERVMLYDLKSMSFLLEGNDAAYNVSRRSSLWQGEEGKKFENQMTEAKAKATADQVKLPGASAAEIKTTKKSIKAVQKVLRTAGYKVTVDGVMGPTSRAAVANYQEKNNLAPSGKINTETLQVMGLRADGTRMAAAQKGPKKPQTIWGAIYSEFAKYDNKALTVPSAFVNPLGQYTVGMVQEFKSIQSNSKGLRSNARAAYENARSLNPNCPVLKEAVVELSREDKNKGTTLLHVIAMDGFVPERKVLSFYVPIASEMVNVKLPAYDPVPSKVARIEVQTGAGRKLATMSPLADISALCLRYQKDSIPAMVATVTTTALTNLAKKKAASSLGGGLGKMAALASDAYQNPDTRSWMSLPSKVYVSRIHLLPEIRTVRIITFDDNNNKLASQEVRLSEGNQQFIFARSIDNALYARASKKIWTAQK